MRTVREILETQRYPRWYEMRAWSRPAFYAPWDLGYWRQVAEDVLRLACELGISAGVLELEEGGEYAEVRIAPLGTPPRPWPEFYPRPWFLRWVP